MAKDGEAGDANAAAKTADAARYRCEALPDHSTKPDGASVSAEQRAKISQAEQELDVLQREAAEAKQTQYYSDPQKALAEQYTRKDVTDQDAKIAAKKDQIAQPETGAVRFGRPTVRQRRRFLDGPARSGTIVLGGGAPPASVFAH